MTALGSIAVTERPTHTAAVLRTRVMWLKACEGKLQFDCDGVVFLACALQHPCLNLSLAFVNRAVWPPSFAMPKVSEGFVHSSQVLTLWRLCAPMAALFAAAGAGLAASEAARQKVQPALVGAAAVAGLG